MMRDYELTREIFNSCSGNQMRDVYIDEISLSPDALDAYVRDFFPNQTVKIERTDSPGVAVFDVDIAGQRQRLSFCEI